MQVDKMYIARGAFVLHPKTITSNFSFKISIIGRLMKLTESEIENNLIQKFFIFIVTFLPVY